MKPEPCASGSRPGCSTNPHRTRFAARPCSTSSSRPRTDHVHGALAFMIPTLLADTRTGGDGHRVALRRATRRVLLQGGADVDPRTYGEEPLRPSGRATRCGPLRTLAAARVIEQGKPVFGICRGMQLINVACGGTLYQDIADRSRRGPPPRPCALRRVVHDVRFVEGSVFAKAFGSTGPARSPASTTVRAPARDGLVAHAYSCRDDLVEAIVATARTS